MTNEHVDRAPPGTRGRRPLAGAAGLMRALLQRVTHAEVTVDGTTVGRIGPGLLILLGVGHGDGEAQARAVASKTANLRIFEDARGRSTSHCSTSPARPWW